MARGLQRKLEVAGAGPIRWLAYRGLRVSRHTIYGAVPRPEFAAFWWALAKLQSDKYIEFQVLALKCGRRYDLGYSTIFQ